MSKAAVTFPEARPSIAEWCTFSQRYTDSGGWIWWRVDGRDDRMSWYLAIADISLYVNYSKPIKPDDPRQDWPWDRWGIGSGGAPMDKGYDTKNAAMLAARPQLAKLVERRVARAEQELANVRAVVGRLGSLRLP
jgi:hypothetical protein